MKQLTLTFFLATTGAFFSTQFASADSGPCPDLTGTYQCQMPGMIEEVVISEERTSDGTLTGYSTVANFTSTFQHSVFFSVDGKKEEFSFFDSEEEQEVFVSSYCSDGKLHIDASFPGWGEDIATSFGKSSELGPDHMIVAYRMTEDGEEIGQGSVPCMKK